MVELHLHACRIRSPEKTKSTTVVVHAMRADGGHTTKTKKKHNTKTDDGAYMPCASILKIYLVPGITLKPSSLPTKTRGQF